MTTVTKSANLVALTTLMVMAPVFAQAQDERLRITFTPAMATVSGDAELALGGSFGYRFSEHFWFEGDFTWIDAAAGGLRDRNFDFDMSGAVPIDVANMVRRRSGMFGNGAFPGGIRFPSLPDFPWSSGQLRVHTDGSTLVGTLGIRYELPVQTQRFRPYLAGGLGINNTDQEFLVERTAFTPEFDQSISHTGYAFTAGAGASVRLFSQLYADVDAKYFRLSRERNIMRLGGGASFRF